MTGSVVTAALLAVVVATTPPVVPTTAPSSAASAATLREIGRIRVTTPLCETLVARAVHAVDLETQNDARLAVMEDYLAHVDLDGNEILKRRGVAEITRQYVTLRAAAVEGNRLMRDFREEAKTTTNADQRANLIAFANALDGALRRQRDLAGDVGRLVAYLDAHEPIDRDTHDRQVFEALLAQSDRRAARNPFPRSDANPLTNVPDPLSVTAKAAGIELTRRASPIAHDEDAAAASIDPAFAAC